MGRACTRVPDTASSRRRPGHCEHDQQSEGVERLLAPIGVRAVPRQQRENPVGFTSHVHAGFLGVRDRGAHDDFAHRCHGRDQ